MKSVKGILTVALLVTGGLIGCKSQHEEGVKSDLRSQWIMVAADTATTTQAAKDILSGDNLKDVNGTSTSVDGVVTGKEADGTVVKVDIAREDAGGSKVTVTVGTIGDASLGATYAKHIKDKAEAK